MSDHPPGAGPDATLREFASGQKLFGRYTLIKILGRGGMGIVWLARDEELEREVALKFLPDPVIHDRALLNDLKRETRRCLELTHLHIVRIHDFVQDERSACISMEYVDGDTLSNLRAGKEQKVFEPEEIAIWTSQLCDALDYAHNRARIIHRDLKPANLMVNQHGDIKVSDFGIARSLGDSVSRLTMEQGRSGTLVYMSPQQLDGERGTHLDDIYSLGATLYDLLTSKPPFYSGNIDRQIHERVAPSMSERRKEFDIEPALVPAVWEDAVAACLTKDPTRRPQSAAEVAQRLQLGPAPVRTVTRVLAKSINRKMLVGAGVAALLFLALAGWYFGILKRQAQSVATVSTPPQPPTATIPEQSIAILPFENLSRDPENAFFANGIQDEILTRLAKIAALRVISRTSTRQYDAKPGNLSEIGRQLRVANLLEGSVQKVADQVRVSVKLINAATDAHVWGETYDRKLTDIFKVESEIATEIAAALRAKLEPEEKARLEAKPTNNPDAYVLYLRAREREWSVDTLTENAMAAEQLYAQAIGLDPTFALAHARASMANSNIFLQTNDPERKSKARAQAEEALRLSPTLGEAHLALGLCFYWAEKDYAAALKQLSIAQKTSPNNAEISFYSAAIYRRQRRWREALAGFQRAQDLDPRNAAFAENLATAQFSVRDWPAAAVGFQHVLELAPDSVIPRTLVAYVEIVRNGNPTAARPILREIPAGLDPEGDVTLARWKISMLERDFATAEKILDTFPLKEFRVPEAVPKGFFQACTALARGDVGLAQRLFENMRPTFEAEVRDHPDDARCHASLGLLYAYLGRKEDAIRESCRAVELEPDRPGRASNLALVYARTGEADQAITLIERLLSTPGAVSFTSSSSMTLAELRLRWEWDPLRSNPRFQKILKGPEPKTVY